MLIEYVGVKEINGSLIVMDGVKGDIARHPSEEMEENRKSSSSGTPVEVKRSYTVEPQTSGYPRIREGARYWLQYAGFADSVYTYTQMKNDYNDDYMSRGKWVNALLSGSSKNHFRAWGAAMRLASSF